MQPPPHAACADACALQAGSRLLWALIAALALATIGTYWALGLSIDCRNLPKVAPVIAIGVAVALFYRIFRPDPRIVYMTEPLVQIFLISLLGALLAYGAAAANLPYRDAGLLAADRRLGFDIRAYLGFVNNHPWLAILARIVYLSLIKQPAIIAVALMATGRVQRLHDFAVALAVALALTIATFALWPALGWSGEIKFDPAAYPRLIVFTDFVEHLESVRNGTLRAIRLADLRGIISFPSFHAAAAVLAVWAIWPVRYARWPMLMLNVLMITSTPIEGAHYLVDVVAGVLVGTAAAATAEWTRVMIRRHAASLARDFKLPHFEDANASTKPQR